jgi:hypothetical protein
MGHYQYYNPRQNFYHDFSHYIWLSDNASNIAIFNKFRIFYKEYEILQQTLKKELLGHLNYFVFSIMHEEDPYYSKIYYDIYENTNIIDKILSNRTNPLYKLMLITYMFKEYDTIEKLKQILYQSSEDMFAYKLYYIHNINSDDPSLLGTTAHPAYIPFSFVIEIIKILNSIFENHNLYDKAYLPHAYRRHSTVSPP